MLVYSLSIALLDDSSGTLMIILIVLQLNLVKLMGIMSYTNSCSKPFEKVKGSCYELGSYAYSSSKRICGNYTTLIKAKNIENRRDQTISDRHGRIHWVYDKGKPGL